jgi:hypothetical protein
MVYLREGCSSRLPIEVFFHLFKLFYGFFYHSRGGIVPFLPCLLLCNNGGKLFLLFLYFLLAHLELLLLHAVVAHPELDTKAQEGCQGIMVNDTHVVAVMHYRVDDILKFLFSYPKPYNLGCFIKLFFIYRHLFLLIDFSIYRGEDLKLVNNLLMLNSVKQEFVKLFNRKFSGFV